MKMDENQIRAALMDMGVAEDKIDTVITQYNQSLVDEVSVVQSSVQAMEPEIAKIKGQIDLATDPTTKAKLAARIISLGL